MPGSHPALTVAPDRFARQIDWLVRQGYVAIRCADWLSHLRLGTPLPPKPVLLTFDDAYDDIARYALPRIRSIGFGACVFVVTGRLGGTNTWDEAEGLASLRLMGPDQIAAWAEGGIEFGAHTRRHPDLPSLGAADLRREVHGSAADLTRILGAPPIAFAYPYGCHDGRVRSCVRSWFPLAFTTEEGLNDRRTDPGRLRRTMVQPGDSLIDFACRLSLGWSPVQHLRQGIGAGLSRLRGARP